MVIKRKRISNLDKYIKKEDYESIKMIGIRLEKNNFNQAVKIGFSRELKIGEEVLPKEIGCVTRINLKGQEIIDKTKEKVERTILRPFHIKDWHGNYHDGIATDVRMCYQKEIINPILIELKIVECRKSKYIIAKKISYRNIKHIINLFLEIFNECEIIYENEDIDYGNLKRLNWKILPKGRYPWNRLYPFIKDRIDALKDTNRRIVRRNINTIYRHNPSFVAVGIAGFSDYIIYGFDSTDKVILESLEINNATYILKNDWENISKMTKAEILQNDLHEKRIIHSKNWYKEIEDFFKFEK